MLSTPATDFVHPVSGLRLLRARLPAEELSALRWIPATSVRVLPPPEEFPAARRAAEEEIKGPVRIRPEPQDRNLAEEKKENDENIEHHRRRMAQEIEAVRSRFASGRYRARCLCSATQEMLPLKFAMKIAKRVGTSGDVQQIHALLTTLADKQNEAEETLRFQLDERFSPIAEATKIADITERRTQLMWTCPNDGQAHPFEWQGCQYHRMYTGEMWRTADWCWAGRWMGHYIGSSPAPLADSQQKSTDLRAALKC
jgi:hypothetical protein